MSDITIKLEGIDLSEFFGTNDNKFKLLKKFFPNLKITSRGPNIKASGDKKALSLLEEKIGIMRAFLLRTGKLSLNDIENLLSMEAGTVPDKKMGIQDLILHGAHDQKITAKTVNQKKIVAEADKNDILFAIGPAGTGKTYTAVALAVKALKEKRIKKIILTRPAVEAGESLGFLPGDLKEKVDPYLRPLYDALDDMIPANKLSYYIENRIIEIAPIAFMRGRTLNNAFIILDEAQNATTAQLKMFLTRIGPIAKCIITGDLTQIDLPRKQESGLFFALDILKNIDGISIVHLDQRDVIRHRLVKDIINAYEKHEPGENQ